jgi:hypothetical protein
MYARSNILLRSSLGVSRLTRPSHSSANGTMAFVIFHLSQTQKKVQIGDMRSITHTKVKDAADEPEGSYVVVGQWNDDWDR